MEHIIVIIIAVTCSIAHAADMKTLISHTTNNTEYVYKLSLEKAEKLPNWNWKNEPPPVSMQNALTIAKQSYRNKYNDVAFLRLHSIQLNSLAMNGTKRDIWGYFIKFTLMKNNRIDTNDFNMVIVLLDGSVIFHEQ